MVLHARKLAINHHICTFMEDYQFFYIRRYTSSDIKQACDGADLAIACLGTGVYFFTLGIYSIILYKSLVHDSNRSAYYALLIAIT